MFERAAQVNARFEGGSSRQAEIVAALHELGVPDERINVIARADPGDWQEPAAAPGLLARPPPPPRPPPPRPARPPRRPRGGGGGGRGGGGGGGRGGGLY